MQHIYQVAEQEYYYLSEGDTALVRYDHTTGRPYLTSLVYEEKTDLYNLPYTLPEAVQDRDYYIETVLTDFHYTLAFNYFHDKTKQARFPSLKEKQRSLYVDLDSLAIVYDRYQAALKAEIDSLYRAKTIDETYYRYLSHRFFPKERIAPDALVRSDSLMRFVSNYYEVLHNNNVNIFIGDNTQKAFNAIARDTTYGPLARKGMLKHLLINKILTDESGYVHYPKELKARYINKYTEITGDSTVVQQIRKNDVSIASLKSVLPLERVDGEKTGLEKLLERYRGKVVYVDFWASWCGPCVGQFPAARELHKRMAGKDVVYIFISSDTSRKSWQEVVRKHSDLLAGSYRILDVDADFLKEIRLERIPRYLIYGRDGKLVDLDAPRPTDKEIDETLMAALNR
ncbi:Redoxin [Bacteroidales bacterium WCE2004]|nr:Redoxin [Bacteroidales bacterium WCE2004]